ncbi:MULTISPECIES: GNAT family N-acetyltransferase [Clostridium]|uniref:GNAT family N-acetyltransferase n=1 Tax=Clostridium senegalense TaxID=1465809 RepID=A0A6M0H151_9CLOT|nr:MULTISPECIES: GNAT family N-acetyltransferase [Clostridium]NEU04227.1 GNAT family N-acetyltransferase [Clostridium senegalense]
MNFIVKKFDELKLEELYEILKLRNQVFVVEQNCPYQDCDDKDKKSYHIFLKDGKEVCSYVRVLHKGVSYDEVSIGRVVVSPKHRKGGLGRKNMLEAIDFIKNILKEDKIRISAQEYLIEFYKSLGFEPVSEVYLEDNIPHIEMLWNLNTTNL